MQSEILRVVSTLVTCLAPHMLRCVITNFILYIWSLFKLFDESECFFNDNNEEYIIYVATHLELVRL